MHGLFDRDHWREILEALAASKLRTFLTAFGVFWGIFLLMVLLGSGTGLHNGVNAGFAGEATNSFFVWTERTSTPYRGLRAGRTLDLTDEDTLALARQVPEAACIAPRLRRGGLRGAVNVTRGLRNGAFTVMGDVPQIRAIQQVPILGGRFLNAIDIEQRRKVAVIGTRVRELLFDDDEEPIGEYVRISGVYFRVVGLFRPSDSGEEAERQATTIHVPFSTFQQAFNQGNRVGWFAVASRPGVPASAVESRVLALLRQRHRVAPDDERAFGHFNLEQEFERVQALFAGIRALIWIVGSGTLAAGVIGVSNIMLVIVRERTHEIGVRRAVGATPWTVMGQIMLEAFLLTAVAGYLGLGAGVAAIELTDRLLVAGGATDGMFRAPDVSSASALQALVVLIIAGTLAGLIPARHAVAVPPVDALRASA
jgi:putative ABC transport system permease protein